MNQSRSLFHRFLKGHVLFIFLPPMLLMFFSAFLGVSDNYERDLDPLYLFYIAVLLFGLIFVAFVLFSWRFFVKLRKRLTSLQEVMSSSAQNNALPEPISVQTDRMDELDQLGSSFNWMIRQLEDSRKREYEEELLRHRLIANLSHDLRTPLTILRGHVTRLHKESMSAQGQNSLSEIDHTITRVGDLMDDLLAYTLLTSGKQPFEPVQTDIVRMVRASVAAWYPVFEEKGIQLDVDLPAEETFYWEADPAWMTRVLDNLLQNILRHAAEGRYAKIAVHAEKEQILVADRGPGLGRTSVEPGAGIGLSASLYMLEKMELQAELVSNEQGTIVTIGRT